MRSRITFLTRLLLLKLLAFITLIALIWYAPATTKTLWRSAGEVADVLGKASEITVQFIGSQLGATPKQGTVELWSQIVGMEKVVLFMGITIALYMSWLLAVALATSIFRRKPARLRSVGASGPPPR